MSKKIPTLVDNQAGNQLLNRLAELLTKTQKLDVATGTFEIGSFLCLGRSWQNCSNIRVLMGDETTRRTRQELVQTLVQDSEQSIEDKKVIDDSLKGLAAVRQALLNKRILVRVFTKSRFHPKCYIMDTTEDTFVDFAFVGSSNFTNPGLTKNLELNLLTTDEIQIQALREWFNILWKEGETVNEEILKTIEPHLKEYDPFTVYAKSLYEYFLGKEKPVDEWEENESVMYPLLSKYQQDGYHRALQMASDWNGALVCDGVGLGKTYIGLMILERCIHDNKRVLLIVPKSAEKSVWKRNIDRYLRPKYKRFFKEMYDIKRLTDFSREGTISEDDLEYYRSVKDVIMIDEAHHFRNPNSNRGKMLMDLTAGKQMFMLTATPINNKLDDLYHLINYFARDNKDHFSSIRVHNLRKHFLDSDKRLEAEFSDKEVTEAVEKTDFLRTDNLLQNVLIQRSRKYVKESEKVGKHQAIFPVRQTPRVIQYSLKNVYASIYSELNDAFHKETPFLNLALYNSSKYDPNPDKIVAQTQKQVIGLIRTLLLKRLESSFKAFEASLENLLEKMARFMKLHWEDEYQNWNKTNTRWWSIVQTHIRERLEIDEPDEENDTIPEAWTVVDPKKYRMDQFLSDLQDDMNLITGFLSKIYRRFYQKDHEGEVEDPTKDEKFTRLLEKLKNDDLLKDNKVLIFTEFRDTARYLERQLNHAGFKNIEEVDSGRNVENRERVISRFAPYYNWYEDQKDRLDEYLKNPIRILISTDVLSEGLNLQDASLLINYDLHWNPVRLMQRIGRLDRRLNPEIEGVINRPKELDMKMYFWNFLPPKELEELLHLRKALDGKILRINKTLGIEGAILSPDDPDMSIKEFNESFEGDQSVEELMNLERQKLQQEYPADWNSLDRLPKRLFTGKTTADGFMPIFDREGNEVTKIQSVNRKGVFFCYRMPFVLGKASENLFERKTEKHDPQKHRLGEIRWYFWDAGKDEISEHLQLTWSIVRCVPETERLVEKGVENLVEARKKVEKHIKQTYLRSIQAPQGAKPTLVAWMEII